MNLTRKKLAALIIQGEFTEIFLYSGLGWDEAKMSPFGLDIRFADNDYHFVISYIAQKRGFIICATRCKTMPPKAVRQKLERELSKIYYEHILILSAEDGEQKWMIAHKLDNKPIRLFETGFSAKQTPELLMQKLNGLAFSMSEESTLTISDVSVRAVDVFAQNAEDVTRKFYERFSNELAQFQKFIDGFQKEIDQEQYAALMLNRLMFIYFIQKKEFLDGDINYLKNRLLRTKEELGKDKFYLGFYRHFLMNLFHHGLGAPTESRTDKIKKLIGEVPYLNGGLFDQHALEQEYGADIKIADEAFEKLFEFFDEYNWHLDNRPIASGKDINPDVIGYIFEKYINDRAKMGAYYTQEDITGYIARNTILPHLLQQIKKKCPKSFKPDGTIWELLKENPEQYIYADAQHGCDLDNSQMPAEIFCGLDSTAPNLLTRRQQWNKTATDNFALSTETWRETIARRERFFALKNKIANGEITDIADLITHNLDIEKLIWNTLQHEKSDFISEFYAAIAGRQKVKGQNDNPRRGISILDPACGSGAFLFAALNVLEPLYTACIDRMRTFVEENDELILRKNKAKRHKFFRVVLKEMVKHNKKYWVYRSIILGNLFGVDFMPEAVEVAKLRLFLKLAAAAELDNTKPNMGLEPLPDIDFNIRAGNSLVGFISMEDFAKQNEKKLQLVSKVNMIKSQAVSVGGAYRHFVNTQNSGTISDIGSTEFKAAKTQLQSELGILNGQLDQYLAQLHGVPQEIGELPSEELINWQQSHKPFHWATEFYEIMKGGGFDVVIGNPPYVKVNKVDYTIIEDSICPDIYGHITAKSLNLLVPNGNMGFVVMHNLGFGKDFNQLREKIKYYAKQGWFSFYGRIPSGLFLSDVRVRNCIFLLEKGQGYKAFHTTRLHRWNAKARKNLLTTISYAPFDFDFDIPRFNSAISSDFWQKNKSKTLMDMTNKVGEILFFRESGYNFVSVSHELPPCYIDGKSIKPNGGCGLTFSNAEIRNLVILLIAGRVFFSRWLSYGDDFRVPKSVVLKMPFPIEVLKNSHDMELLKLIFDNWENSLEDTFQSKLNAGITVGTYNTSKLWHITNQSDLIFLKYMTKNPEEVMDAIITHTSQTIKTRKE